MESTIWMKALYKVNIHLKIIVIQKNQSSEGPSHREWQLETGERSHRLNFKKRLVLEREYIGENYV